MKAMRAAEPQKPKEITVVAGDGKSVKIQLGGDQNEDSRKQVAEAAGAALAAQLRRPRPVPPLHPPLPLLQLQPAGQGDKGQYTEYTM